MSFIGPNVLGIILATREGLKYFGNGGGSVVNIGSTITSATPPATVVCAATKGAVNTITRGVGQGAWAKEDPRELDQSGRS